MIWFLSVSSFYVLGILVKDILNLLLSNIALRIASIIYFIYWYSDLFSEIMALSEGLVEILTILLTTDNLSFPQGHS